MELIYEKLLGFFMVLTRISAFFLILPIFGWKTIPVRIKVAFTVLLTIFFSMIIPVPFDSKQVSVIKSLLLLANEATYGLALGLIAYFIFTSVKFCGRIIERQMGLSMAQILDPLSGENTQALGALLEMIFILLFLSANGHHLFIFIISRSYETFPAGNIPTIAVLTEGIIKSGSTLLMAGLKLSAPILAAFLLLMVVLAVFARMIPEMNILFISLPMRVGMGLLMVAIFLPFLNTFVAEFADWMGKLLPI
jgi:flagellar biosynthetic protein FliR